MTDTPGLQARTDGCWLVFGASGYIGGHLVPRLLAEGRSVRAVARNPAVLEGRGWDGVELAEADALPSGERPALEGAEVIVELHEGEAASARELARGPGLSPTPTRRSRSSRAAQRFAAPWGVTSRPSSSIRRAR